MWNLKMIKKLYATEADSQTWKSKVLVYQRVRGEKQIRNTGLTDINCNTQNRKATRIDRIAQGITFSIFVTTYNGISSEKITVLSHLKLTQ